MLQTKNKKQPILHALSKNKLFYLSCEYESEVILKFVTRSNSNQGEFLMLGGNILLILQSRIIDQIFRYLISSPFLSVLYKIFTVQAKCSFSTLDYTISNKPQ